MTIKVKLLTPIPKHSEALRISKDSQKIENVLNDKLVSLINSIQKLEKHDQSFIANDYKEKINTSIRRSVEQIYQIGGNYAANFTGREYYTTRTDLNTIERLATDYIAIFNQRLQRFVISPFDIERKTNPKFIVNMTTATLTQDVMRQAIIAKSQQILTPITITTAAFGDNLDENAVLQQQEQTQSVVYVWVTSEDDKVCPICSGYEGQAWAYEDYTNIPDIPDDTHPNCRCIIQLSEAEVI